MISSNILIFLYLHTYKYYIHFKYDITPYRWIEKTENLNQTKTQNVNEGHTVPKNKNKMDIDEFSILCFFFQYKQ